MDRELVENAVLNYVGWCETISKIHQIGTKKNAMIWYTDASMPSFNPEIISLKSDAIVPEIPATTNTIFDSFAQFQVPNFSAIVQAQWITSTSVVPYSGEWRWIHDEEGLTQWIEKASLQNIILPTIIEDSKALFFYKDDYGGFAAYQSSDVIGITAIFGDDGVRQDIPAVLANFFPDIPIVGYDAGAGLENALSSGWTGIGPLKLWTRNR